MSSLVGGGVLDLSDEKIRDLLAEAGGAFLTCEGSIKKARQSAAAKSEGDSDG